LQKELFYELGIFKKSHLETPNFERKSTRIGSNGRFARLLDGAEKKTVSGVGLLRRWPRMAANIIGAS